MEAIRTYDSQCGSRCGIICYVKDGVFVKAERDPDHPNGGICPDRVNSRVVCTQHGWWQACPSLGLPGYDPYSQEGANVNLLVSNDDIDPISGSVPHRSYLCNVKKA